MEWKKLLSFVLAAVVLIGAGCDFTNKDVNRSEGIKVVPELPGPDDDGDQSESGKIDSDGDGLSDTEERALGTDPHAADSDGDGLSDGEEINTYRSNPLSEDTDSGGINDGFEVARGTSPTSPDDDIQPGSLLDADNDGLSDEEEVKRKTDPNRRDSDGDGLSDGAEVYTFLTDPLNPDSDNGSVQDGPEVAMGTRPSGHPEDDRLIVQDSDDDGLSNATEKVLGTDPLNPDTDGDGLGDGIEVNTVGSDPLDPDTDFGGVGDGAEVDRGMNPLDSADDSGAGIDSDNDGLNDVQEIAIGTDRHDPDSDDDGLNDGTEVLTHATDPLKKDTDEGGEGDGSEVACGRDPLNPWDDNPYTPLAIIFIKTPSSFSEESSGSFVIKTADSVRIEQMKCGIDTRSAYDFLPCQENTAFHYKNLSPGQHIFSVWVSDTDGYDHKAEFVWEIKKSRAEDPCEDKEVTTKEFTVTFAVQNKACEFGKNGNLAKKNGFLQATHRQNMRINLPAGGKLCGITAEIVEQNFQFDDHFVLTWNDIALATNADHILSPGEDGYPLFHFPRVKGQAFGIDRIYCLGDQQGSQCAIPAQDSGGKIRVKLSDQVLDQVREIFATRASHDFSLDVVGDNDNSDCRHGGLQLRLRMSYTR